MQAALEVGQITGGRCGSGATSAGTPSTSGPLRGGVASGRVGHRQRSACSRISSLLDSAFYEVPPEFIGARFHAQKIETAYASLAQPTNEEPRPKQPSQGEEPEGRRSSETNTTNREAPSRASTPRIQDSTARSNLHRLTHSRPP